MTTNETWTMEDEEVACPDCGGSVRYITVRDGQGKQVIPGNTDQPIKHVCGHMFTWQTREDGVEGWMP